jgi:hypothetical protein
VSKREKIIPSGELNPFGVQKMKKERKPNEH